MSRASRQESESDDSRDRRPDSASMLGRLYGSVNSQSLHAATVARKQGRVNPNTDTINPDSERMTDDEVDALAGKEPWPEPLDPAALHGLACDIVRMIEPQTEADSAALPIKTVVAFGDVDVRIAYYQVAA